MSSSTAAIRHPAKPTELSAPAWVMIGLGYACIIAGGLVAAVAAPLDLYRGSWVSAYLVLVGGIAQLGLGWAPGWLGRPLGTQRAWWQLLAWNLGNAVVIVSTLALWPLGVSLGSILLVIALALALLGWFGRRGGEDAVRVDGLGRLASILYLGLIVLLIVSIPVGILLANLR